MTGKEWAVCDDPRKMVQALARRGNVSNRKWRLFIAAFWRWQARNLKRGRADLIERSEAMEHWAEVGRLPKGRRPSRSSNVIFFGPDAESAALQTAEAPFDWPDAKSAIAVQPLLLRDIFGNPFRKHKFDSRWRTSDVLGLARAIYDERAYERMPILADALMDAGCENEEIINHCRGDGPHVRGCWVVDLILGKE
jgi:hypothetical protein